MKIKGQINGRVVNKYTGEVSYEFEQENIVIGSNMIDRFGNIGISFFNGTTNADAVHQYIGGRQLVADLPNMVNVPPNVPPATEADKHWLVGAAVPIGPSFPTGGTWQVTPAGGGSPWFIESTYQWDPPAIGDGDRTTWTVGIVNDAPTFILAYAVLNSACVQTEDVDILLITYRISFIDAGPNSGSDFTRINYDSVLEEGLNKTLARTAANEGGTPSSTPNTTYLSEGILARGGTNQGALWNPNIPTNDAPYKYARTGTSRSVNLSGTGNHNWVRDKVSYSYSWDDTENIGRIYGSVQWMGAATGTFSNNADTIQQAAIWTTAVPSNFPNKPVQVIHNHNAVANRPFLDALTLASGQGTFSVGNVSWDKTIEMPQFWRLDIVNTGEVGTSRYFVRARSLIGFSEDHTYMIGPNDRVGEPIGWINQDQNLLASDPRNTHLDSNIWSVPRSFWDDTTGAVASAPKGGMIDYGDDYHYMCYSSQETRDSFTIFNFLTGWNRTFNSTTTPALPVSGFIQIEADANGDIWVADPTAGLFKITDPLGSPTVTTYLPTVVSAPNGTPPAFLDETICYGVHPGYNGSVWALFHGNLARTDDGGTSWIHHYPGSNGGGDGPDFDITDLTGTTGEWANARLVKMDIDSPNFEMGVCRFSSENNVFVHWWSAVDGDVGLGSPSTGTPATDPFNALDIGTDTTDGTPFFPTYTFQEHFTVSKRGGGLFSGRHGNRTQGAQFGDASFVELQTNGGNINTTTGNPYFYDVYGKPYVMGQAGVSGFGSPVQPRGLYGSEHQDDDALGGIVQWRREYQAVNSKFGFTVEFAFGTANADGWRVANMTLDGSTDQSGGGDSGSNPAAWNYPHNDTLNTEHSIFQEAVWTDYRWDPTAMSWKAWWNTDAIDTSAAANGYNGTRFRFDVEDHKFVGRSRIDATAVLGGGGTEFTGDVMTFLATVNAESKAQADDPEGRKQRNKYCLLSLTDGTWRNCVNFYWSNVGSNATPDGTGSVTVEYLDGSTTTSTTEHVFGSTPAVDTDTRIVFVISGTSAICYVNGSALGTPATIPATTASGAIEMYVGATAPQWRHHVTDFFRGNLTNIQFWDVAFTAGDVTADHAAGTPWTGVVVPGGASEAGNLVARYELNQSLVGAETKTTHFATEALPHGLEIDFSNGASSPAFVDTDFYTFGVCDGILKDNAISFTLDFEAHGRPVDYDETDIEDTVNDPGGSPVSIPALASSGVYTDGLVPLRNDSGLSAADLLLGGRMLYGNRSYAHSPYVGAVSNFLNTFQYAPGDCLYEMTISHGVGLWGFGLTETPGTQSQVGTDFALLFANDTGPGTSIVDVVESGSTIVSSATTWAIGDKFTIRRVGSTITYRKNDSTFYTSLTSSSVDLWGRFITRGNIQWNLHDVTFEYERPGQILDLGVLGSLSGKYSADYWMIDDTSIVVTIDGSPATVIIDEASRLEDLLPGGGQEPGAGTCVAVPDAGILVFATADVGLDVTASYTLIRFR